MKKNLVLFTLFFNIAYVTMGSSNSVKADASSDIKPLLVELKTDVIKATISNESLKKSIFDYLPTILAIISVITTAIISVKSIKNSSEQSKNVLHNQNELFISQKRQDWINELREVISNLISTSVEMGIQMSLKHSDDNQRLGYDPKEVLGLLNQYEGDYALLELTTVQSFRRPSPVMAYFY